MTSAFPERSKGARPHWMPWMNYRVRAVTFVFVFLTIATHIGGQGYALVTWLLLAAQFLVYPHLVWLAGRYSVNPVRTETCALVLDPLLLGAWLAALGFPLWISYDVALGTLMSIGAFRSWKGMAAAAMALVLGAAVSAAVFGFRFSPDTSAITTFMCMAMLTAYLLMMVASAQARTTKLRATKVQLRENEEALQRQLEEINTLQALLAEQVNRDPLTGVFNRRYLDATLPRELARCRRNGRPLSLILIDLDHFKNVNDTLGHPAGDEVIKALANLLRTQSRNEDVVCRHGGEEFLVMLPDMELAAARVRAEHYRMAIEVLPISTGTETHVHVTLSAGVAAFPHHGQNEVDLIRNADKALYHAKAQGRNRVVVNCRNKGDTACHKELSNCIGCCVPQPIESGVLGSMQTH